MVSLILKAEEEVGTAAAVVVVGGEAVALIGSIFLWKELTTNEMMLHDYSVI
jgi:hypothetical protein